MIVSQIVAASENWIIGRNNRLPWNMPEDIKWFNRITMGKTVIMGRRNYEANGSKALPGRTNIVLSRRKDLVLEDARVVSSLEEALGICREKVQEEVFIVGGGEIYRLSRPRTDRIYLTVIHITLEGDTTYPEPDMKQWHTVFRDAHPADRKNPFDYTFLILEKPDI